MAVVLELPDPQGDDLLEGPIQQGHLIAVAQQVHTPPPRANARASGVLSSYHAMSEPAMTRSVPPGSGEGRAGPTGFALALHRLPIRASWRCHGSRPGELPLQGKHQVRGRDGPARAPRTARSGSGPGYARRATSRGPRSSGRDRHARVVLGTAKRALGQGVLGAEAVLERCELRQRGEVGQAPRGASPASDAGSAAQTRAHSRASSGAAAGPSSTR